MIAIIFNSGLGKRMGDFTKENHKSMVKLENGETIFERQLRILSECGVKKFIVTVGPHKEQLINASLNFNDIEISFVENPIYDKTNYIYSMYLAEDGYVLFDNMVFHNMIYHVDEIKSKNTRSLVKKIIKFRESMSNDSRFDIMFYDDIGDGLLLITRR